MTFADADLVDGDVLNASQVRLAETSVQMPFEDILDHIPADAQQPSNVQHRHRLGQCQDKACERLGVPLPRFGNTQLDPADKST